MAKIRKARVVNLRKESYEVYIGRGSIWGNPFVIGKDGTREEVIEKYREHILDYKQAGLLAQIGELYEKRLGCFCKPKACHGDILVELLNKELKKRKCGDY